MVTLSVQHNIQDSIVLLDDRYRKQIPFAIATALNSVARDGVPLVKSEMQFKFDRPTPFTLNSLFIKYASKNNLTAMVYVKDREMQKSKSLAESIGHEFSGGERVRKRLEYWLSNAGYISSSERVVPGEGAQLDAYGNLSRGQIQKILSQLRAGADENQYTSKSKRSNTKRRAEGYFWSRGGKLKRGVWQRFNFGRMGGAVKPILIVVSGAHYKQRIDMDRIVTGLYAKNFDAEFSKALAIAIRTAK